MSLYEELSARMPGLYFFGIVELVANPDAVLRNGVWMADLVAVFVAAVSPRGRLTHCHYPASQQRLSLGNRRKTAANAGTDLIFILASGKKMYLQLDTRSRDDFPFKTVSGCVPEKGILKKSLCLCMTLVYIGHHYHAGWNLCPAMPAVR